MVVKLFEVRDRGTFMPVMAVRLVPTAQSLWFEKELWLLRRAGYSIEQLQVQPDDLNFQPYIVLCKLDEVEAQYDPFRWPMPPRTLRIAHMHIIDNWWELNSGDLIDVEFIVGESKEPKPSEKLLGF